MALSPEARNRAAPGMILSLPPLHWIPETSVLSGEFRHIGNLNNCNTMLVIGVDHGIVQFLPLVVLDWKAMERARDDNRKLIWPQLIPINEAQTQNEYYNQQDYRQGVQVNLAGEFFRRLKQKYWVDVARIWFIEEKYLVPYGHNRLLTRSLCPPPPIHIEQNDLSTLLRLGNNFATHPICKELRPPRGASAPRAENLKIGHIYRLPARTENRQLLHGETLSFVEQPLNKPFLVTGYSQANEPDDLVRGFVIASFNDQPIIKAYKGRDDKTKWIRSNYMLIEGPGAVPHDNVLYVKLGAGSPRMRRTAYVGARTTYHVRKEEILCFTAPGEDEVFIDKDSLKTLLKYATALNEANKAGSHRNRVEMIAKWKDEDTTAGL